MPFLCVIFLTMMTKLQFLKMFCPEHCTMYMSPISQTDKVSVTTMATKVQMFFSGKYICWSSTPWTPLHCTRINREGWRWFVKMSIIVALRGVRCEASLHVILCKGSLSQLTIYCLTLLLPDTALYIDFFQLMARSRLIFSAVISFHW